MSRIKLLTISDGFGDSKAVPSWYQNCLRWPELIGLMTNGVDVLNYSRYGAGNEYIIEVLKHHHQNADAVLVQWAGPQRLDLLLDHKDGYQDYWEKQIATDSKYSNNMIQINDDRYWLSSSSDLPDVIEYHNKYITLKQQKNRSRTYIEYASLLLKDKLHGFMLTFSSEYIKDSINDQSRWFWHEPFKGMSNFRSLEKYKRFSMGLLQPTPLIAYDFIIQYIKPNFDIPWKDDKELANIKEMLYNQFLDAEEKQPK